MKLKPALYMVLISIALSVPIMPQSDVHLFQGFLKEASVSSAPFVSGYLINHGKGLLNTCDYNLHTGYPLSKSLEARISFGPGGLGKYSTFKTDAALSGIYNVVNSGYLVSAGAFVTLPLSANVEPTNEGYGIFGSLKKPLTEKISLTADAGIDVRNQSAIFKALFASAGAVIKANEKLAVIAEGQFWAEDANTLMISSGADYKLLPGISLRGVLGFNLLDTGEDLRALFGASYSF
ncbi:MAG TPA: hypothetical protein VHO03_01335 [Ignavibacteriales bacterium]|nr:hypothetical protein [Ignavibacteriales bacterium]